MCQIKVTEWINQKFNATVTDSDYEHIKDFLLLWNLYESHLFNRNFKINEAEALIDKLINQSRLNHSSFSSIFLYFQQRYTTSGVINPLFSNLRISNSNHRQFVESTLRDNNPSLRDKIVTSTIIIFRFRSNLFHGEKDITRINYQKSNFINANEFMIRMLES